MWLIDKIAEQRIREAAERGEFDDLPGSGKRLELEDDALVPEELRAGYRLLKNAGYLPAEIQLRKDIADVEALIRMAEDSGTRERAERRLRLLESRLGEARGHRVDLTAERDYRARLSEAVAGRDDRQHAGLDSKKGRVGGEPNECPAGDDGTQSRG